MFICSVRRGWTRWPNHSVILYILHLSFIHTRSSYMAEPFGSQMMSVSASSWVVVLQLCVLLSYWFQFSNYLEVLCFEGYYRLRDYAWLRVPNSNAYSDHLQKNSRLAGLISLVGSGYAKCYILAWYFNNIYASCFCKYGFGGWAHFLYCLKILHLYYFLSIDALLFYLFIYTDIYFAVSPFQRK